MDLVRKQTRPVARHRQFSLNSGGVGVKWRERMTKALRMTDQTHLEEQLAHLQRVVDELSDIVARQQTEIDRLTRRVEMLMQREAEREADQGGTIPLADQRPPHW